MKDTNKKEYPLSAGAEIPALLPSPGDMGPQLEKTESNFYFSPAELVFVACVMKKDYVKAGSWPQDARPVSDETYSTFVATPPEGKTLGADKKGQPRWADKPAPTPEQLIAAAERKKDSLMSEAERTLAPLERADRLGMAADEENNRLKEWQTYSVLLTRVDTSKPVWPERPQ
ncbi:tail fiber assembly protein [Yokenella regensburgei]|uniref:tail fiber assembly protein n=1 Tax=Yokenella regensburgei TaxID=158877 RepID=UPI003EDA3CFE